MGRIKTVLIKRLTYALLREYGDKFTNNYEKNKKVVGELLPTASKKIRNVIAGYATRLVKSK